jgi:hypothetical protein
MDAYRSNDSAWKSYRKYLLVEKDTIDNDSGGNIGNQNLSGF